MAAVRHLGFAKKVRHDRFSNVQVISIWLLVVHAWKSYYSLSQHFSFGVWLAKFTEYRWKAQKADNCVEWLVLSHPLCRYLSAIWAWWYLHWLDVPERVQYKLGVTVRRCQQHKAPQYLIDCVTSASDIASRQWLRSASRHQLLVPPYRLSSLGRRSFAVAGPTLNWLGWLGSRCQLTSVIRRVVTSLSDVHWKHSCSLSTSVSSALEVFLRRCAI